MTTEFIVNKFAPCRLESFKINGIEADVNDFGFIKTLEKSYCGCLLLNFVPSLPQKYLLSYYGITEKEYYEIIDKLKNIFNIEFCCECVKNGVNNNEL